MSRKPLPTGPVTNRTVSLDELTVKMLVAVGDGNLSAGIRRAARLAYDVYQRQPDEHWQAAVARLDQRGA